MKVFLLKHFSNIFPTTLFPWTEFIRADHSNLNKKYSMQQPPSKHLLLVTVTCNYNFCFHLCFSPLGCNGRTIRVQICTDIGPGTLAPTKVVCSCNLTYSHVRPELRGRKEKQTQTPSSRSTEAPPPGVGPLDKCQPASLRSLGAATLCDTLGHIWVSTVGVW